jgi:NADH dehydrogenase
MATQILVLGTGHVGLMAARRLQKKLRPELGKGEVRITVVSPDGLMTYQPFLAEAAAGNMEPRHVVVGVRNVLDKCHVVVGRATRITTAEKKVTVQPAEGPPRVLSYDHLVVAIGAVPRVLPIPGLADVGVGFTTIGEAIHLRNQVISRLEVASATQDPDVRRRALTVCVVGGGYAGTECVSELNDMMRAGTRHYRDITPADLRFVLVEAAPRIMPEVDESLGRYTVDRLTERGIEVRLGVQLTSCIEGHVVLSDGETFDTDTLIWTAGVKANPVVGDSDLPLDDKGRVVSSATLRVPDRDGVWAAGDNAAVPDLSKAPGTFCAPSAQHAVRQAAQMADNIWAEIRHGRQKDYKHAYAGSVASLGLYRGAAQLYGFRVKGVLAWFIHRTYHLSRMPTFNRKVRILMDWTLALFFPREIVSLGQIEMPHASFASASSSSTVKPAERRAS